MDELNSLEFEIDNDVYFNASKLIAILEINIKSINNFKIRNKWKKISKSFKKDVENKISNAGTLKESNDKIAHEKQIAESLFKNTLGNSDAKEARNVQNGYYLSEFYPKSVLNNNNYSRPLISNNSNNNDYSVSESPEFIMKSKASNNDANMKPAKKKVLEKGKSIGNHISNNFSPQSKELGEVKSIYDNIENTKIIKDGSTDNNSNNTSEVKNQINRSIMNTGLISNYYFNNMEHIPQAENGTSMPNNAYNKRYSNLMSEYNSNSSSNNSSESSIVPPMFFQNYYMNQKQFPCYYFPPYDYQHNQQLYKNEMMFPKPVFGFPNQMASFNMLYPTNTNNLNITDCVSLTSNNPTNNMSPYNNYKN